MLSLFAAAFLATQAAAPQAQAADPDMPCDIGLQGMVERLDNIEGAQLAQPGENNPFFAVLDQANEAMYFLTVDGQPAHPSVIKLQMDRETGQMRPSGCTYGDRSQVDELLGMIAETLNGMVAQSAAPATPSSNQLR